MSALGWLIAAVATEVVGLASLRASRGLRRPTAAVLAFAGILGSTALIGQATVSGMSLAVAYGVWTGAGIGFATLGGVALFGDQLDRRQVVGLGLVLVGVIVLNLGGAGT